MKGIRPSITLMIAVAGIIAVDLAILTLMFREIESGDEYLTLVVSPTLPTANVLVLLLMRMARDLHRTGESGSFALGFVVAGCGANALTQIGFAIDPVAMIEPVEWTARHLGYSANPTGAPYVLIALVVATWTPAQLLLAFLGGWLARRIGLKLVIESRRTIPATSPESCRVGDSPTIPPEFEIGSMTYPEQFRGDGG